MENRGQEEADRTVLQDMDSFDSSALSSTLESLNSKEVPPDTKEDHPVAGKSENHHVPRLGENGQPIRALNFAGGGYDTVMQLGVTHALLVSQAKPPDAVIGVSAGAIQATALAEILQAGIPFRSGTSLTVVEYEKRLAQRVVRLREFLEACHRSPERILDAALPDAYQIDSHDPIQPLETPIFNVHERQERIESLRRKSGLIRLYNDILKLHLPFGTITRALRRMLGFHAADDLQCKPPKWLERFTAKRKRWSIAQMAAVRICPGRWLVKAVELTRAWLLLGTVLPKLVPVVPIVVCPLIPEFLRSIIGAKHNVQPSTAGSLIFRFRVLERVIQVITAYVSLLLVFSLWLGISWVGILLIPSVAAGGVFWLTEYGFWKTFWWAFLFDLAILLLIPMSRSILNFDQNFDDPEHLEKLSKKRRQAFMDMVKGVTVFLYLLIKWSLAWFSLLFLAVVVYYIGQLLIEVVIEPLALSRLTLGEIVNFITHPPKELRQIFLQRSGMLLATLAFVPPIVILLSTWYEYKTKREESEGYDKETVFKWYRRRFLEGYGIEKALFHEYGFKKLLIELFDHDYYGTIPIDHVVNESLQDGIRPSIPKTYSRKKVGDYAETQQPPIHVGIAVADVRSCKLKIVEKDKSIIDAILGANAIPGLFEPKIISDSVCIDAGTISNVPTRALRKLLENKLADDAGEVYIYSVSPLPISRPQLNPDAGTNPITTHKYLDLVDITMRALQLQRFRDAFFEKKLTELFSRVIPREKAIIDVGDKRYFRARVIPIELRKVVNLNQRILFAHKKLRRDVIAETIADGCRAAMESMILPLVRKQVQDEITDGVVSCRTVVEEYREQAKFSCHLPGSSTSEGPGLPDICMRCSILNDKNGASYSQALETVDTIAIDRPIWPNEIPKIGSSTAVKQPNDSATVGVDTGETDENNSSSQDHNPQNPTPVNPFPWPRDYLDNNMMGQERPTVSLLFSGGVFRGVFQMGVINALNLLNLKPDLIAGASIGSITAAMVATTFSLKPGEGNISDSQALSQQLRKAHIARLTSIYLAMDRLILTDRFADFVRNLTIRAADSRFSLRDADHVFRKYDYSSSGRYSRQMRRVLAGLERVFYINPYELNKMVELIRNQDANEIRKRASAFVQKWLDRMEVGEEVLGAEPLDYLIQELVLLEQVIAKEYKKDVRKTPFDNYRKDSLYLLATTTNLTKGSLEVLGKVGNDGQDSGVVPTLMEGLLSSSAFPGVFRPRWSWELYPNTSDIHQYIDGGVMDNFPLDAVLEFLFHKARAGVITARPKLSIPEPNADDSQPKQEPKAAPHLVFAASLEVDPLPYKSLDECKYLTRNWPELQKRAKQLRYNMKLDTYSQAERQLSDIFNKIKSSDQFNEHVDKTEQNVLDIEVVAVKPRWLCDTFAFHPMLGFRRINQAKSIAHGCATTLITIANTDPYHRHGWGVDERAVPNETTWEEAYKKLKKLKNRNTGKCWLKNSMTCPYSPQEMEKTVRICDQQENLLHAKVGETTHRVLTLIYAECQKLHTHMSKN